MPKQTEYIRYYKGIKVDRSLLTDNLEKNIKIAQQCLAHELNGIFNNLRKYRRGKNRCLRCGYAKTNK